MLKRLMIWHKRLALICALPLLVWALSGLIHPIMSHFAKADFIRTTNVAVNATNLQSHLPLKQVLINNSIAAFSHASIVEHYDIHLYQVVDQANQNQNIRYFDVVSGRESNTLSDIKYAMYLAEKWSKLSVAGEPTLITEFSAEYAEINRILPVYKIPMESGNFLYIDTLGKRIAAHNTPMRESLSYWFKQLHTFAFLADKHSLFRIIPMVAISVIIFIVGIFGMISYGLLWNRIKGKARNSQYFHRTTGISISLSLVFFATSSTHILLDKLSPQVFRSIIPGNQLIAAQLNHDPLQLTIQEKANNFQLVNIEGQTFSQLQNFGRKETQFTYKNETSMHVDSGQLAISILTNQLGIKGEIVDWQQINKFGATYAFINKRLPVIQLTLAQSPDVLYSVEPHTGYLANVSTPWERARSWHFGYLHKYHFLNPLGKGTRDIIITIIILGICTTVGFGLSIYVSRKKRASSKLAHKNKLNLSDV